MSSEELQRVAEVLGSGPADAEIPDRRLALMFACAHPAIEAGIRAPLILQVVLGLDAATIASAFLISPATMGQRLVRAKTKIRQAGIPFSVPEREELSARLDTVLAAIYAAFAEGWTDPGGTDLARRDLTEEALFLARLVTELLPEEPEALGLLALMLHAEARRRARRSPDGEYVPLAQQDSELWDARMIGEAETLLRRASDLGSIGRYQLEAALQSAHVYRCRTGQANWAEVVQLYDALLVIAGSPVVAINRALALAELHGRQRRSCGHARSSRRCAPRRIPTLLGSTRGIVGKIRRIQRGTRVIRDGNRSGARPLRPQLSSAAAIGAATSTVGHDASCPYGVQRRQAAKFDKVGTPGVPVPPRTYGKALARFASAYGLMYTLRSPTNYKNEPHNCHFACRRSGYSHGCRDPEAIS